MIVTEPRIGNKRTDQIDPKITVIRVAKSRVRDEIEKMRHVSFRCPRKQPTEAFKISLSAKSAKGKQCQRHSDRFVRIGIIRVISMQSTKASKAENASPTDSPIRPNLRRRRNDIDQILGTSDN